MKNKYKGTASDSSLRQHGGEEVGSGKDSSLLEANNADYCGPGKYLSTKNSNSNSSGNSNSSKKKKKKKSY